MYVGISLSSTALCFVSAASSSPDVTVLVRCCVDIASPPSRAFEHDSSVVRELAKLTRVDEAKMCEVSIISITVCDHRFVTVDNADLWHTVTLRPSSDYTSS